MQGSLSGQGSVARLLEDLEEPPIIPEQREIRLKPLQERGW